MATGKKQMAVVIKVIIAMLLILSAGVAWVYFVYLGGATSQTTPEGAATAFMRGIQKITTELYGKEKDVQLQNELNSWVETGELSQRLKKLGALKVGNLFDDEIYGKVMVMTMCRYWIDSFSFVQTEKKNGDITITVEITPKEMNSSGKVSVSPVVSVPMYLKKLGVRWYLVDIGGSVGKIAKSIYKRISHVE